MGWFRWHDGSTTDPKFRVVAKLAAKTVDGVRLSDVLALWAMLLERANGERDGVIEGFDCDVADAHLDMPEGAACAIIKAMQDKSLISGEAVTNWDKRQPKKEDLTACQRKRDQRTREKMSRDVTPSHEVTQGVTPCHDRLDKTRQEEIPPTPLPGGEGVVLDSTQGEQPEAEQPSADPGDFPSIEFEQFWEAYPRKEKKITAWKAWRALGPSRPGLANILAAVCRFAESDLWQKENGRYVQQPHKWLEGRRWLDEPTTTADAQEGPPTVRSYSDEQLAAMGITGRTW